MRDDLVYIAESGLMNMVFDSQVLHFMKAIKNRGVNVHLGVMEIFDVVKSDRVLAKLKAVKSVFPDMVYMRGMPMLGRVTSGIDALRLSRKAHQAWGLDESRLVHARGHFGSYTALKAFKNQKVICDLRGLVSEELRYYPPSGIRKFLKRYRIREIALMEKFILSKAAHILCVSHAFKEYLSRKHSSINAGMTVIPTVVDTEYFKYDGVMRESFRRKLGIHGRIVFIYSGGLSRWQMPDHVIRLFRNIKRMIPEAYLIFLTHRPERAKHLFGEIKQDDYTLESAAYTEVAQYLMAADIGIILREQNSVNQVAAPAKFGEYLCCGLPVVLNRGIGDTEKILSHCKAGGLLKAIGDVPGRDEILEMAKADRPVIAGKAAAVYSIEHNSKRLMHVYDQIHMK